MNTRTFIQAKTGILFFILVFASFFSVEAFSQNTETVKTSPTPSATPLNLPKVTQIDNIALKKLIKPSGKPLLINFWATWCDPCREEFPDLVKISVDYKDKIDFITISMDDLAEIKRDVPKFLAEMKAEMPAYLLKSQSEDAAIMSVSKNWQGALPFTILFNEKGETVYFRQGKVKIDLLRAAVDKLSQVTNPTSVSSPFIFFSLADYNEGKVEAQTDISAGNLVIKISGRGDDSFYSAWIRVLKEKYGVTVQNRGCSVNSKELSYNKGYNEISESEIKKRFGEDALNKAKREAEEISENNPAEVTNIIITDN